MGGEAGRAPSGGLRSCACSRTGWGRHHHHTTTTTILQQDVLQGSVLSSLPLLFFIDDLWRRFWHLHANLFADDVTISEQEGKHHMVDARLQQGLDTVNTLNKEWKMLLLAKMSECHFFSTNWYKLMWQPTHTLDGQPVRYNATPKFFGVMHDCQLTFSCHATLVDCRLWRQSTAQQKLSSMRW